MIEVQSATLLGIAGILLTILGGIAWMLRIQTAMQVRIESIDEELRRHEVTLTANGHEHAQFIRGSDCRHWQEVQAVAAQTRFTDIQRQLNEIKAAIDKLPRRLADG
jgi:lysylphosphatidylglycerol synthetase-like protein (DUF2156 family)